MDWRERFLNKIIEGDSQVLLKEIPSESLNLVVTSPPYYKQRDYGDLSNGIGNEETVEEYLDRILSVFHECIRITKRDGSIVFNLGDKYEDGGLLIVPWKFAIEAIKREPEVKLIHTITWVKSNPTPRQFKRRLVSSTEPFFHFVKSDDYYFNIDSFMSILTKRERRKNKENLGKKYFELIEKAPLLEEEKRKAKEELEEVIQEVREGKIAEFRMKIRGIHAPAFGGQEGGRKLQLAKKGFTIIKILGNAMKRDVIECPVETLKGNGHPAVYPEKLIDEIIKLLTKPGDIVLDPFAGSGTTAVAAKRLGRNFIGIDIIPRFCRYAEERLEAIKQITLL